MKCISFLRLSRVQVSIILLYCFMLLICDTKINNKIINKLTSTIDINLIQARDILREINLAISDKVGCISDLLTELEII